MAKKTTAKPEKEKKPRARTNQPVPPEITEARERRAYELRVVDGVKLYEITTILNVEFPAYPLKSDHEAVRKMVKRVQNEYAKRDKERTDAILAESSAVIDWVRREAKQAFEVSKLPIKTATQREQKVVEQKAKTQAGDATFLKRINETVEIKSKLFGVMAPKKHEVTGKDGAPLVVPPFDLIKMREYISDDDLDVLQKAAKVVERAKRDYDAALDTTDRSREAESKP